MTYYSYVSDQVGQIKTNFTGEPGQNFLFWWESNIQYGYQSQECHLFGWTSKLYCSKTTQVCNSSNDPWVVPYKVFDFLFQSEIQDGTHCRTFSHRGIWDDMKKIIIPHCRDSSKIPKENLRKINVSENRRGNQEWTIQRHWHHWAHKTQEKEKEKRRKKSQHNTENKKDE